MRKSLMPGETAQLFNFLSIVAFKTDKCQNQHVCLGCRITTDALVCTKLNNGGGPSMMMRVRALMLDPTLANTAATHDLWAQWSFSRPPRRWALILHCEMRICVAALPCALCSLMHALTGNPVFVPLTICLVFKQAGTIVLQESCGLHCCEVCEHTSMGTLAAHI